MDGGVSFGSSINLRNNAGNSLDVLKAVSGNNVHVVWFNVTQAILRCFIV
jgi:hypothetical protein